jgi:hypothetical protein
VGKFKSGDHLLRWGATGVSGGALELLGVYNERF